MAQNKFEGNLSNGWKLTFTVCNVKDGDIDEVGEDWASEEAYEKMGNDLLEIINQFSYPVIRDTVFMDNEILTVIERWFDPSEKTVFYWLTNDKF